MRLFFDIVTGTWGNADDLRIVDRDDLTEDDLFILGEASDSEIIDYGKRWGVPVPEVGRMRPLTGEEEADYLSGYRDFPGAVETEDGVTVPE